MSETIQERLRDPACLCILDTEEAADYITALEADNKRLREALEFYADRQDPAHKNPNDEPWGIGCTDFGTVACAALDSVTGGKTDE